MNMSQIFKKAHEITKAAIKAGDNYRVTFGAALRILMTKPVDAVEALKAIGGKLWEKAGMSRVYFDAAEWMGIKINRYNTGNIASAYVNGEKISNSEARRMISSVEKVWFDNEDGKFYSRATNRALAAEVIEKIKAAAGL